MSAASRSRRTTPTRSTSPRRATSSRTTSPYLFRSTNGGRSWQSINGDFPAGEITRVVRADPVRKGLLFVGTETGIYFTCNDGQSWSRMAGGLPVVPVYDLKIKGSDLVAGTHGRSFWILDDITPLRDLADGGKGTRLFAPRTTIRTKLHFGALRNVGSGISFAVAPGISGGIRTFEKTDGTTGREHLDVGENPPNGAIVYYWLEQGGSDPVSLSFRDASGRAIISFGSGDRCARGGAAPHHAARPQPLRLGYAASGPGQARRDADDAAEQAALEGAGSDGRTDHGAGRVSGGAGGRRREADRAFHHRQGPAPGDDAGGLSAAIRTAAGARGFAWPTKRRGQPHPSHQAPAHRAGRPAGQSARRSRRQGKGGCRRSCSDRARAGGCGTGNWRATRCAIRRA